jgi:hypothetical protein
MCVVTKAVIRACGFGLKVFAPEVLQAFQRSIFARGTPGTLWNILIIRLFAFYELANSWYLGRENIIIMQKLQLTLFPRSEERVGERSNVGVSPLRHAFAPCMILIPYFNPPH